ncbi:hypothetical protein AHiyo4_31530 [Arthrobacter sp. Hiyo4]|nr:hypothetical protein AHiyo4_31530 [Arthrobacter sp. Hiyo4]
MLSAEAADVEAGRVKTGTGFNRVDPGCGLRRLLPQMGCHSGRREDRQDVRAAQCVDHGRHIHMVGVFVRDQHGLSPARASAVSENVPGSSTSTPPSFSSRTHAWVYFVSFIAPA